MCFLRYDDTKAGLTYHPEKNCPAKKDIAIHIYIPYDFPFPFHMFSLVRYLRSSTANSRYRPMEDLNSSLMYGVFVISLFVCQLRLKEFDKASRHEDPIMVGIGG